MINQPTYGLIAYEAYDSNGSSTGIRAANAADGSGDYSIIASGYTFDPSWEPGGRRLAFSNAQGIAIINADGSGMQQLTSNACSGGCDFYPAWSPSNGKIAFCSLRTGNPPQIWEMNSDGSGVQQITSGLITSGVGIGGYGNRVQACNLRWNPNGNQIAFTGLVGSTYSDVFTMNSDGSNVTQLTNCIGNNPYYVSGDCFTPSWSPDGHTIVFSNDDTIWGDNLFGAGIYRMNPDGSGLNQPLSALNSHNWFPHFSTDGGKIFFTSNASASGSWGVWSINPDGSGLTQVIGGTKKFPYQADGAMDCSVCGSFGKL